jgi:hypothetical protein
MLPLYRDKQCSLVCILMHLYSLHDWYIVCVLGIRPWLDLPLHSPLCESVCTLGNRYQGLLSLCESKNTYLTVSKEGQQMFAFASETSDIPCCHSWVSKFSCSTSGSPANQLWMCAACLGLGLLGSSCWLFGWILRESLNFSLSLLDKFLVRQLKTFFACSPHQSVTWVRFLCGPQACE